MKRQAVHAWGFFDAEGRPRLPDGVAMEEGSVYAMHKAIESNVVHFGGDVMNLRITRSLDGELLATEFETPAREGADRMWHQVSRAQDPWPSKPSHET